MTRKEAFEKIKSLLKLEGDKNFESVKTTDGTILLWEGKLETGVALYVTDEAGTQQAVPDGTYTLEDGSTVTTEAGLLVLLEPKKEEDEMASVVEMLVQKFSEKIGELEERCKALEAKEGMIKEEVEAKLTEVVNEFKTDIEGKFTTIKEVVDVIAETPATAPIAPVKTEFSKSPKEDEYLSNLVKSFKKIKE